MLEICYQQVLSDIIFSFKIIHFTYLKKKNPRQRFEKINWRMKTKCILSIRNLLFVPENSFIIFIQLFIHSFMIYAILKKRMQFV